MFSNTPIIAQGYLGQLVKHHNSRLSQTARTALSRVRLGAAFAVRSGDRDKAFELAAAGLNSSDEEIAIAAVRVLSQLQDARVVKLFSTTASDSRPAVRYEIYKYFSFQKDQHSADMLVRFTTDADDKLRLRSAGELATRTDPRAIDPLLKLSRSDNEYVRREAAKELGNYKTPRVIQRLTEMLSDKDDHTRSDAIKALVAAGGVSSTDAVFRAIDEATGRKQLEPLIAILGEIEDPRTVVKLTSLLAHDELRIRRTAARALTRRGDTILRVDNVKLSLDEPRNNRRVVNADFALHDEHVLTAKWRLWMILLDDEGKTHGRSSTTFLTYGRGNEAGGTIETATLTVPMTVSNVWSPGGRFRFGVEFVPPSQDELAAQLAKTEGNVVPDGTVPLSRVDETAEDKRNLAASGHAVRFARPGNRRFVEAIQIFGSRYGTATPPKDDFHVYLLNEKFQVLSHLKFPYALIPRGDMKWHTLRTPSIEVPETFHAAVAFNPHRTKGVYLGLDENVSESHSFTGLVGDGFSPWEHNSNWMIRIHLAAQPTGEQGIQNLADWKPPALWQ